MITGPDCTTGAIKFPGGVGFSDDMVIMPLQCATQWDALSHCFEDGLMYNGYDANEVSSRGAKRNGIDKVARGIVARGVLLDVARAKGVNWLEPGYAITAAGSRCHYCGRAGGRRPWRCGSGQDRSHDPLSRPG